MALARLAGMLAVGYGPRCCDSVDDRYGRAGPSELTNKTARLWCGQAPAGMVVNYSDDTASAIAIAVRCFIVFSVQLPTLYLNTNN